MLPSVIVLQLAVVFYVGSNMYVFVSVRWASDIMFVLFVDLEI